MLSTITGCRKQLQQWAEVLKNSHPSYQNSIPYQRYMNIGKLGSRGVFMSDTCNGARKTYRLIVEKVHEAAEDLRKYDSDNIHVLEVDCWNQLRNV